MKILVAPTHSGLWWVRIISKYFTSEWVPAYTWPNGISKTEWKVAFIGTPSHQIFNSTTEFNWQWIVLEYPKETTEGDRP